MQAVTEVLNKSRYGNSHLQIWQNPIPIAEDSGHRRLHTFCTILTGNQTATWPIYEPKVKDKKSVFGGIKNSILRNSFLSGKMYVLILELSLFPIAMFHDFRQISFVFALPFATFPSQKQYTLLQMSFPCLLPNI